MANIPTNLIAVVIVLGFLIFIHEAGHFLMAKLFRVKVLVFSPTLACPPHTVC